MKLLTLLGAALVAAAPAPALAIARPAPAYARAMAVATCVYRQAGMTQRAAFRRALDDFYPIYRDDFIRDGATKAGRLIVDEQAEICGLD